MRRTKLIDRSLPDYTHGEEIFNMVSHIVGGAFGLLALILCTICSAERGDVLDVTGSVVYGISLIVLYTISSVYHGLHRSTGKKVMQVLDHCAIYFLIGGSYTTVLFSAMRRVSPGWCWTLLAVVWLLAVVATVFTAIDLKRYNVMSMICYIGMGWCILVALRPILQALHTGGFQWLLAGGIAYSLGAVLYGLGSKYRYMHSVFHIFVVLGSILQFICVYGYML